MFEPTQIFSNYEEWAAPYQKVIAEDDTREQIEYNYPFFKGTVVWQWDRMNVAQQSSSSLLKDIPPKYNGTMGLTRAGFDWWLHDKLVIWAHREGYKIPENVARHYRKKK